MDNETEIKFKELEEAALPLLEFLNKYYNPHCYAIVTEGRVEIVSGEMSAPLPIRDWYGTVSNKSKKASARTRNW